MKYIYELRIKCDFDKVGIVTSVVGTKSTKTELGEWVYQVEENQEDPHFEFVNEFLNMIENRYVDLKRIGVEREQISIWMYYEYDQQCNIEFTPNDLARLGNNGITLCISCWEN